jgi:two-component system chemotaxis response regulator CheY
MPDKETHFLIIDDSFSTRQSIRSLLVHHQYENISEAENGISALGIINESKESNPIGFVLCDYNMPNLDGLQFLEVIKKQNLLSNIPFVLITAQSDLKVVSQFLKMGVSQFLVKPFESKALLERIEMAHKKHSA